MPKLDDRGLRFLQEVMRPGRAERRMRIGANVAIALSFMLVLGPVIPLVWFAAVWLLQNVIGRSLAAGARQASPGAGWPRLAMGYLAFSYLVMGALALAATLKAGVWGLVNGEFLLFCLCFHAAISARKSRLAYIASIVPLGGYLVALAALGLRLDGHVGGAVTLAVGTLFLLVNGAAGHKRVAEESLAREQAKERAEAATAAKSAFVAMVSHELRTPLSAILAGAAELQRVAPDGAARSRAVLITEAAQMMRSLLNDLLDVAKLEAGRMTVEEIEFDLRRQVRDAVKFWRPETRKRGLALKVQGAQQLPERALGDPTRLRQILNNLFSNALKFTDQGSVTLRIAVEPGEGRAFQLVMEVVDTGPGMDAEQLGRLFTPFEQLTPGTARTHGGTGLGLSISRELARVMGGDLTAASEPGEGAAFRLELPMTAVASRPRPERKPAAARASARRLRALIVDDHAVNRKAFALVLGAAGIDSDEAADGREALERLAQTTYDIVLMDLNMANMGGLEAVTELRNRPGPNRPVPVIALTGSTSPREIAACLEAGMDAYVQKPAEPGELLAAIDEVLSAAERRTREAA